MSNTNNSISVYAITALSLIVASAYSFGTFNTNAPVTYASSNSQTIVSSDVSTENNNESTISDNMAFSDMIDTEISTQLALNERK
jgi:hypothetical protein